MENEKFPHKHTQTQTPWQSLYRLFYFVELFFSYNYCYFEKRFKWKCNSYTQRVRCSTYACSGLGIVTQRITDKKYSVFSRDMNLSYGIGLLFIDFLIHFNECWCRSSSTFQMIYGYSEIAVWCLHFNKQMSMFDIHVWKCCDSNNAY